MDFKDWLIWMWPESLGIYESNFLPTQQIGSKSTMTNILKVPYFSGKCTLMHLGTQPPRR